MNERLKNIRLLLMGLALGATLFAPVAFSQGTSVSVGTFLSVTAATVSQLTSNSTTVVANGSSVMITSFGSYSTAHQVAATAFTLTDSAITANSVVQAQITQYGGTLFTNGFPQVVVGTPGAGSVTLQVVNTDATNALNGAVKIAVIVL